MRAVLEDPKTAEIILQKLSKLATLPEKGIVAGGSVASIILSIIDQKEYPINDVDIFINFKKAEEGIKRELELSTRIVEKNLFRDSYTGIVIEGVERYRIVRNEYKGILNLIYFDRDSWYKEKFQREDSEIVIDGFDINQTMVAIDLETKKLYYRPEFLEFLEKRELHIVNPFTPIQSLARAVAKSHQLNIPFATKPYIQIISAMLTIAPGVMNKNHKSFKQYIQFKHIFDKYFTVRNLENELVEVEPKYPFVIQNLKKFGISPAFEVLKKIVFGKKSEKSRILKAMLFEETAKILTQNPDATDVELSIKELEDLHYQIESFDLFPKLHTAIFALKLTFSDLIKIIKMIEENGLRKDDLNSVFYFAIEKIYDIFPTATKEDFIKIVKENIEKISGKPLTQPIDLSDFPLKDKVREIITENDIRKAGEKYENCLRHSHHFADDIEKGLSRLFEINNSSLLEIRFYNQNELKLPRISQHLSKRNKSPNEEDKKIAEKLIAYIVLKDIDLIKEKLSEMVQE